MQSKGNSIKSDQDIINAVTGGDVRAFQELVKRYEQRVAATVIGMLGQCPEAEDVGQETFIRFYQTLSDFRGESSVVTYLTRIAINLSLNELKRRKRQFQRDMPLAAARSVAYDDARDHEPDQKEIIQQAIQKLSPKHRAVIVLRLLEGYSTKETAQILKLAHGTVLSRLSRGLEKLKELLEPYLGKDYEI